MIADLHKAQRKMLDETLKVTRLADKMTLARSNFADAATDEDPKRMESHRMELHEITDQLLDALVFTAKIKKQILDILLKSDPNDWPKT